MWDPQVLQKQTKNRPRTFQNLPRGVPDPSKIHPGGSKIEPWELQNRAWKPPRRNFCKTCNLRRLHRAHPIVFWGQNCQFHVLRTYRRAAGGERKAQVNANRGFLQQRKQFSKRKVPKRVRERDSARGIAIFSLFQRSESHSRSRFRTITPTESRSRARFGTF